MKLWRRRPLLCLHCGEPKPDVYREPFMFCPSGQGHLYAQGRALPALLEHLAENAHAPHAAVAAPKSFVRSATEETI